jgi:hypothetical protein
MYGPEASQQKMREILGACGECCLYLKTLVIRGTKGLERTK